MQFSPEFEAEDDLWRLSLHPSGMADSPDIHGDAALYLHLVPKARPNDYTVRRCFRLRVLHPTDERRSTERENVDTFSAVRNIENGANTNFGWEAMIRLENVPTLTHKDHIAIQAVVWTPPPEAPQPEAAAAAAPAPAVAANNVDAGAQIVCTLCAASPVSCLVTCCRALSACDGCILTLLHADNAAERRCPWCRHALAEDTVHFGVHF